VLVYIFIVKYKIAKVKKKWKDQGDLLGIFWQLAENRDA
jgi:hypothetical protein